MIGTLFATRHCSTPRGCSKSRQPGPFSNWLLHRGPPHEYSFGCWTTPCRRTRPGQLVLDIAKRILIGGVCTRESRKLPNFLSPRPTPQTGPLSGRKKDGAYNRAGPGVRRRTRTYPMPDYLFPGCVSTTDSSADGGNAIKPKIFHLGRSLQKDKKRPHT